MFLGFVFPGWLWLLNTPGDVEMLTLAGASVVGVIGVLLFIAALVKRLLDNRHPSA